jgi:hypothetical protein
VSRRTWAVVLKCSAAWVGDMALVVGAVEVHPIPAADSLMSASITNIESQGGKVTK